MKKIITLTLISVLAAVSLTSFSSCSAERDDTASAKTMYDKVMALLSFSPDEEVYYSAASEAWNLFNEDVLIGKYGDIIDFPEPDTFDDYAAYYSTIPCGPELGIFRMKTEEQAEKMKLYIDDRMAQILKNAVNYPSTDTTLIKNYTVTVDGVWVYYAATENNSGFNKIVKNGLYH